MNVRAATPLVPAILVAILPKCPLCFAAYGALFGVIFAPVWWITLAALVIVMAVALARGRWALVAGLVVIALGAQK